MQEKAGASPHGQKLRAFQRLADQSPARTLQRQKKTSNHTGLPDGLKAGVERLSGVSLDSVKVHYNSAKPAQLNAHAYAQGHEIHLAPGQERHLPHEAWHVVQQAQGRVRPTTQLKGGVPINDDAGLESEADVMGSQAASLQTSGNGPPTRPAPNARANIAQRVRFANTNSFYGDHFDAGVLPDQIKEELLAQRHGEARAMETMVRLNADSTHWIHRFHPLSGNNPVGELIWIQMRAEDWAALEAPAPTVAPIDIAGMGQAFFDQQNVLMGRLNAMFAVFIAGNPGRPLRVASFELLAPAGHLQADYVVKPVEAAVAPSIEHVAYPEGGPPADLTAAIRTNVLATLFAAHQGQWLEANWPSISATHNVFIDVDFYPNRLPDRGGILHKDSVGETLFVNLTYNNAEAGAAPEYAPDLQGHAPFEATMPEAAAKLIADSRHAQRDDDGQIKGVELPARGRVSFTDPAIWHATPLYGHRLPLPTFPDEMVLGRDYVDGSIRVFEGLTPAQKVAALHLLPVDGWPMTGAALKAYYRAREPLRFATPAGSPAVDTAPLSRRPRARSLSLQANPESLQRLEALSGQPRSFIRTWIILRRR